MKKFSFSQIAAKVISYAVILILVVMSISLLIHVIISAIETIFG